MQPPKAAFGMEQSTLVRQSPGNQEIAPKGIPFSPTPAFGLPAMTT